MRGELWLGLAVGVVVGGAAAIALLPEPRARLRELRLRLGELSAPDEVEERAAELARLGRRALALVEDRCRLALTEAQQAREEARRELWARYEVARREGRLPLPPA